MIPAAVLFYITMVFTVGYLGDIENEKAGRKDDAKNVIDAFKILLWGWMIPIGCTLYVLAEESAKGLTVKVGERKVLLLPNRHYKHWL